MYAINGDIESFTRLAFNTSRGMETFL